MQTGQGEESRSALRVPVKAQAKVHFANLGEFVNAYATNLSLTGMFIRTHEHCPAGALPNFELKLSDSTLIKGVGEVAWSRPQEESEERPAGTGIRILHIDQNSRDIIIRIVDRYIRDRAAVES